MPCHTSRERIWLGVGVNVPFGLETDWDPDWMGRFHATKSKVQGLTVSPTIALQLSDTLSVGGGANWQEIVAAVREAVQDRAEERDYRAHTGRHQVTGRATIPLMQRDIRPLLQC